MSFSRLLSGSTALLCACSVNVGEGSRPTQLYLGLDGEQASANMSECTTVQLNAYVVFTSDSGTNTGTYNDRVQWTSQNPSIVVVSDGITPSPDGNQYSAGTLIALRPGAATISAAYLDFQASITVDVEPLYDLRIDNPLTDIGAGLDQAFALKAVIRQGQPEQDISSSGVWRFDPATAQAYVDDASGLVHANSSTDGAALRLVTRLPECDREVSTQFRISPVTTLQMDYVERGDATELPYGFSEAFQVTAGFADTSAPRQNITTQTSLDAIDDDYLSATLGEDAWYVTAQDRAGSGALRLSIDALDRKLDSKQWQVRNTPLRAITLTPDDLSITYPDTGQLQVFGRFEDGLEMPVTRHVSWSSSDSSLGTVNGGSDDAGEVTTFDIDGDFEVTASIVIDDETLDETVMVHAYANRD